jgi:DNA replication protein DnaC
MNTEKIIDAIAANVPMPETEIVIAPDGFKRCAVCGKKLETVVEFMNVKRKVPCVCDCTLKKIEEAKRQEEEQKKKDYIAHMRRTGFPDDDFKNWTFENDDMSKPEITSIAKKYIENFKTFKNNGKGLLFYGTVGTGKTYAAAEIANALIDMGKPVLMTNFSRIINKLQSSFEGRQEYIDGLNEFDLLILDDLAAERQTEYVLENVFNVIDARYRAKKPLIITTNLSIEQLKNPENIATARIYDRILERCFPIEVKGASNRRRKIAAEYDETKALLGL